MALKPSSATGVSVLLGSAMKAADAVSESEFPPGVFNLASGAGSLVGKALCAHARVDMVSLTGSTEAGRRASVVAAGTIKRTFTPSRWSRPNEPLPPA